MKLPQWKLPGIGTVSQIALGLALLLNLGNALILQPHISIWTALSWFSVGVCGALMTANTMFWYALKTLRELRETVAEQQEAMNELWQMKTGEIASNIAADMRRHGIDVEVMTDAPPTTRH